MRHPTFFVALASATATLVNAYYRLDTVYQGPGFFDGFDFFDSADPTHGHVDYVSRGEAEALGLIWANNDVAYMGADKTNVAYGGRKSVRIQSKARFTEGLFVMELNHMPTGCGTWPAFWLCGPDWPNAGEIDIIEGVDNQASVQTTLHTNGGCNMYNQGSWQYTGNMLTYDCDVNNPNQPANAGCGIEGESGTFGASLNGRGGGVFALEWDGNHIAAWYWPYGAVPGSIYDSPETSTFGTPYAYFTLGGDCPASHFKDHQIIFDLTFCGDWEGSVFPYNCPNLGSCTDYVTYNPQAFGEAYWLVKYVKVFKWTW